MAVRPCSAFIFAAEGSGIAPAFGVGDGEYWGHFSTRLEGDFLRSVPVSERSQRSTRFPIRPCDVRHLSRTCDPSATTHAPLEVARNSACHLGRAGHTPPHGQNLCTRTITEPSHETRRQEIGSEAANRPGRKHRTGAKGHKSGKEASSPSPPNPLAQP